MADAFDREWERQYAAGRALNRYPYDVVVSLTSRYFGGRDRSGLRVLDLGCGAGNHSLFFARLGFEVTGIDVSGSAIAVSRQRFADEGFVGTFHEMTFEDIGQLTSGFDLVLDRGALCCADFDFVRGTVMPKLRTALKPDGVLFSWFLSSENPLHRVGSEVPAGYTVQDVHLADGDAALRLTQLDQRGIESLFSEFDIVQLYHDRREELFVAAGEPALGVSAEYVVVCRQRRVGG